MSANLVVDLGGTCDIYTTLGIAGPGSGLTYAASGAIIGLSANMINDNTATQVVYAGNAIFGSGQLRLQIQVSDSDVSGTYTDPTSGLAAFPSNVQSGGLIWLNSGQLGGGVAGAFVSGQSIQSGFAGASYFQRIGTFARVNVLSGDFFAGSLTVSLLGNKRTTGSGGGFTFQPLANAPVNV